MELESEPTTEGSTALMIIPDIDEPTTKLQPAQTILPPSNPIRLESSAFPHPPRHGAYTVPTTIENLEFLLGQEGVSVGFNVIKKRVEMQRPNRQPVSINEILSLASRHGLQHGLIQDFIEEIAARKPVNPAREWIESKPWDGTDRLQEVYDTIATTTDYPPLLKHLLLYRWLLSAVAAALSPGRFGTRGVLTLQGPQGIGKTKWIASLIPAGQMRNDLVKLDHHFDGGSKDSIVGAVSHWFVEWAELEGMFRKEISKLKSFITNDCDKIRLPYGRTAMEYDRRTVFAATVNDYNFLVDKTGNNRWLTIACEKIKWNHEIDMQQVYAQLAEDYTKGEQHWLTDEEEGLLNNHNEAHREISATGERVRDYVEAGGTGKYMTPTEILAAMGIKSPSMGQCKDCATVLRELVGPSKRVQGRDKWRVPEKVYRYDPSEAVDKPIDINDVY